MVCKLFGDWKITGLFSLGQGTVSNVYQVLVLNRTKGGKGLGELAAFTHQILCSQ